MNVCIYFKYIIIIFLSKSRGLPSVEEWENLALKPLSLPSISDVNETSNSLPSVTIDGGGAKQYLEKQFCFNNVSNVSGNQVSCKMQKRSETSGNHH